MTEIERRAIMRHIVGLVCCIAMLGALLFLAASLPTGTPITAHTTLAVGQDGHIGFETITLSPAQFLKA
jgi:hypothetical protein